MIGALATEDFNAVSQGDTLNMHGIHWHGNVVDDQGRHADSLRALSSTTRSVNLIADNPGTWLFHCHASTLQRSSRQQPYPSSCGCCIHGVTDLPTFADPLECWDKR